jgi:hypothetical protein
MVRPKKVAACAMAFTMAMSAVLASGCGKKPQGANEKVSADSVWYNLEKHELSLDYDVSEFDYIYSNVLGKTGDYYAVEVMGSYSMPSDVDWSEINYLDYYMDCVEIFDKDGNNVNKIDIIDTLRNSAIVDDYAALMEEAVANMDESDLQMPEDIDEEIEEDDTAAEDADAEEDVSEDAADADVSDEEADADEISDEEISDEEIFDEEDYSEIPEMDMSDAASNFNTGSVTLVGDKIQVNVSFFNYVDYSEINYIATIDPATGDLTYELDESASAVSGNNEGIEAVGDYQVEQIWISGEDINSYVLNIYDASGLVNTVDLTQELPDEDIYDIQSIFGINDTTLLVSYYSSEGGNKFFTVDVQSGSVQKDEDGEYGWLNNYSIYNAAYFNGIGNVVLNDEGIQTIDFDAQELSEVFSFDSCNVNRSDVSSMKLMSYSEDEIIFAGTVYRGGIGFSSLDIPQLIVLTKADSNPNAGKTILTAATVGYIDYAMSEAVCVFNETNPDYFIQFDNRYRAEKHMDNSVDYEDYESAMAAYNDAEIELSNQLTVDLMAGEGPDIIFDTSHLSQLNNDDYLIDLSDRVNTEGLFANVIEAAKTGDKLYQLPLTFGVTGLAVLNENVEAGQTGFTFDQYADFVSTVCNGNDPLAMDQTEFFIMCMEAMGEQFVTEDGKIDYDNDAFRSLAEFTNEHVSAPIEVEDEGLSLGGTGTQITENGAARFEYGSFEAYIELLGEHADDTTILGLPSIDGRGPMLSVSSSVAISAQSAEVDACWSFVETLLSTDVQEYYAQASMGCPMSVSAYESSAQDFIDEYNDYVAYVSNYMSPAELSMYGMSEIDSSVIDSYETMIDSCSAVSTTDAAITAIIREEMPGYFSGQKTLDDVISVMEDRVQTFLDERD